MPRRSSALFGNSIHGGCRFIHPFEMLAEAGDVAVADALGDAGDGEPGCAQEFGCFFESESLQVGLEAEAVLLAEESGEIAWAGEGDFAGDLGEIQRAMQTEDEMRDGTPSRITANGRKRLNPTLLKSVFLAVSFSA